MEFGLKKMLYILMFISRLKSKNTLFFMKYLKLNYDNIFIKKFN